MGKKRVKNCEEKPSGHKIGGVASGQQKQETSRRLRIRQKLEEHLRDFDEPVNRITKEVSRQRMLAKKLVQIPIKNNSSLAADSCKETFLLSQKMIVSARDSVPGTVLVLLSRKLMARFGPSYRSFVANLLKNIWIKVHIRCLQEDAGVSDEEIATMQPLHALRLLDAVNDTHTPSAEGTMKVLVTEFGLHTPDIISELVEKMVKAFAELAPDEAKAVFAKVAQEDAMALAVQVRGLSFAASQ